MAAVVTITDRFDAGNANIIVGTIALDSSYPTGGEAISANALGLGKVAALIPTGSGQLGYHAEWDGANSKLLMFYADYDAGADGALIQVPDTTDLSAVTALGFVAIGR